MLRVPGMMRRSRWMVMGLEGRGRDMRAMTGTVAFVVALTSFVASSRADEGRFFLLVSNEPPQPKFVQSAYRVAQRAELSLPPDVARERIGGTFPRLFGTGRSVERSGVEADLKAGRAAYFNGQFKEAEAALTRAIDAVVDAPELVLGSPVLLQRLVDGAAIRYANALGRKVGERDAKAQLEGFLRRYPQSSPTPSEHPPEILAAWNEVRTALKAATGAVMINARPVELERNGSCRVMMNGAEVAELPLPGPLSLPRGTQLIQVRCGVQTSWLQRVEIGTTPVTLRVPVRAMIAAYGDPTTGGLVLVEPAEGDAAALVSAVSAAVGLDGAVVARTGTAKVDIGRWESTMDGPTVEAVGTINGNEIENVRTVEAKGDSTGGGRVWTWVVGGVGLATLGGAVIANVVTADKIKNNEPAEGLKTTTVALYVAGGALVATSIILFFVEGDSDPQPASAGASLSPGPGGFSVRF